LKTLNSYNKINIEGLLTGAVMRNLAIIEDCYKKYIKSLYYWIPEGIQTVDLRLLQKLDLLHIYRPESQAPPLTRYFHIIESPEKITLINDEFVVWIIPDKIDHIPVTFTLIALNKEDYPHLELAFVSSGIYNTSKFVLRILEKFLLDIQENETLIKNLS
jgi:hypothetical protein